MGEWAVLYDQFTVADANVASNGGDVFVNGIKVVSREELPDMPSR